MASRSPSQMAATQPGAMQSAPLPPSAKQPTARAMTRALYLHFMPRYAVLSEVTCREAEATQGRTWPTDRRCDVLLHNSTERIAVEIKVTRADFLSDVKVPEKQAAWVTLTHRQAYAVPKGLVSKDEVPDGFGLIYVDLSERLYRPAVAWEKRAPKRPGRVPAPLPARVERTLLMRLSQAEAHAKGYGWQVGEEDPGALRAQVTRLERDLDLMRNARDRADERARDWQRRFATCEPPPCGTCAQPLRPEHGRRSVSGWKHLADADEAVCRPLREAAEQARIDAMPEDGYRPRLWTPEPYPADALRPTQVAS